MSSLTIGLGVFVLFAAFTYVLALIAPETRSDTDLDQIGTDRGARVSDRFRQMDEQRRLTSKIGKVVLPVAVVLFAVALAFDTMSPSGAYRSEGVPWTSATVTEDGRRVTVEFLGVGAQDPNDPCHVDYSLDATERGDEVTLTVRGRERTGDKFCTLGASTRQLAAELTSPLAGRRVVDGHDGRVNAVRSLNGECLQTAGIPDAREPTGVSTTSTEVPLAQAVDDCDV